MPKKMLSASFGARLKRARLDLTGERGGVLSPEKLGAKLGVSGQTVRNWESGEYQPSLEMIERLAPIMGVSAGFLAFAERPHPAEDLSKYDPADEIPAGAYETIEDRDKRLAARKKAASQKKA